MMIVFISIAAFVTTAVAHGGVIGYTIQGEYMKGYGSQRVNIFAYGRFSFMPYNSPSGQNTIEREWSTFNPIEKPQTEAIICNSPGTPAQRSATVPAGSSIKAHWNQYSHNVGPLIIWMAECPSSCNTWNAKNGRWFKIDEQGLLSGTVGKGNWGSGSMIAKNLTWTIRIPKSLKAGDYLLRTETVAMHSTVPQFYPNCAHLKISGSGTSSPGAQYIARLPGVYSLSGKMPTLVAGV
jgi:hypothetical protein